VSVKPQSPVSPSVPTLKWFAPSNNRPLIRISPYTPVPVAPAIDQCAKVGFEMVILSFGSGLNMESEESAYAAKFRELADYAKGNGVELGGYSLLASRRVSDEDDCINPKTGKPGGMTFGDSPCLGSRWGEARCVAWRSRAWTPTPT